MIIGIGLDLVETARVRQALEKQGDRFLDRVFTPAEVAYCRSTADPAMHLAARFAAKEACAKALGTGLGAGAAWADIEVVRDERGKPGIVLTGNAARSAEDLEVSSIFLSITHTDTHAAAVVVLEK